MEFNANDFMKLLDSSLSALVDGERTVIARFSSSRGFTDRPHQSGVFVSFYNLPEARIKEGRGGGAEAENNRMLFVIRGFDEDAASPVASVKIAQSINSLGRPGDRRHYASGMKNLRAKTGSPDKIAMYLAKYINEVAEAVPPNYTHD